MKTTPIAEFLARKAGDAPRPRAEPPKPLIPRKVSVANDDDEPDFRRSGLVAALARRSPEGLVRPIDPSFAPPRRDSPPRPMAPPAELAADVEAKLAEAYHRGVQEGLDAAKAEAATARALERAEWQKRAVVEKLDFQMNEYARLSEAIHAGFAELERRVAQAAARALKPLLKEALARQIVEELAENLQRLTRSSGLGLIKVRGPQNLLSMLKSQIEALAVGVDYVEEDGVEITVAAQSTEIRTEFSAWERLIDDIVENG